MPWFCSICNNKFVNRSEFLLHSSVCVGVQPNLKNCDIGLTKNSKPFNGFHLTNSTDGDDNGDDNEEANQATSWEQCDDSDADPDWDPAINEFPSRKRKLSLLLPKIKIRRLLNADSEDESSEELGIAVLDPVQPPVPVPETNLPPVPVPETNLPPVPVPDSSLTVGIAAKTGQKGRPTSHTPSKPKRKKGIRLREQEKIKKDKGEAYKDRAGKLHGPIEFKPITDCCKSKKCYNLIPLIIQTEIFKTFYSLPIKVRDQAIGDRIEILDPKRAGGFVQSKSGITRNRMVTVHYNVNVNNQKVNVCKSMFMGLYGVTRGKLDILIEKVRASMFGHFNFDGRGQHTPPNKTSNEEITLVHQFIDKYPRHVSHYARRDNSAEKIFLPSYLNVKKMHNEYLKWRAENGYNKSVGVDIFRKVFKTKGYKIKEPLVDTCKTCDEFKVMKRNAAGKTERDAIEDKHKIHVQEAQDGYDRKREDKTSTKCTDYQRLLVFDLQQILPVPYLTTNIAYYKRLLTMYNLTTRDCSREKESSTCSMWSELEGGRGSEQIASCIFKELVNLPPNVEHVITYSDTCGGQNRNINIAVMFMYALSKNENLKVIDQKFLLPGHTRLECDSDHARIERAKKKLASSGPDDGEGDKFKIMVPRDWCQFVRALPGKKSFNVTEMKTKDFKAFSAPLKTVLVHRNKDVEKQPVEWLKIKWLRYTEEFGVIFFKYDLNPCSPFRKLNLIRDRKGRKINAQNLQIPDSYSKRIGINPLKKKDLLSILSLIDKEFHDFYKKLPTSSNAPEFDEISDTLEDSESEDNQA